jgi:hypothetical protein
LADAALASIAMKEQPPAEREWERLSDDLTLCLADLSEDEFLVISSKRLDYYVQFAAQGLFGMRAEATSNAFIKSGDDVLSTHDYADMVQLGWKSPSAVPDSAPEPDGSSNFFIDVASPVDFEFLAKFAVVTLHRVYDIPHPGELQYKSFRPAGTKIRFPTLRIKRKE